MNFVWNQEQLALRTSINRFLAANCTSARVRESEPTGFDESLWKEFAALGISSMGIPERHGGGGAGLLDLTVVATEFGRFIAPFPFIESSVAGRLIARFQGSCLDDVLAGSCLPTIALAPITGIVEPVVPAGAVADVVVAFDGRDLVALRRERSLVRGADALPNLGSLPLARWRVEDPSISREVLATGAAAEAAFETARSEWQVLMAAALDGVREQALGIGIDYVVGRRAFGVPIGSFQAVKHRLADRAAVGSGAQLLVYEAAWSADCDRGDAAALASMAFLLTSDTALWTCRDVLQFHGGYGFTLEYDIQLYFRRAKAWPAAFGDPRREYVRLADLAFVDAEGS